MLIKQSGRRQLSSTRRPRLPAQPGGARNRFPFSAGDKHVDCGNRRRNGESEITFPFPHHQPLFQEVVQRGLQPLVSSGEASEKCSRMV